MRNDIFQIGSWNINTMLRPGRKEKIEDVRVGLGKMKIQNWSETAMNREVWNRTDEQANTQKEL
jgi:hypothetical protein